MGDCNAYQDQGGVLVQLATDMSFCLIAGTCPEIRGACCDDDSGVCYDNVDLCPPPLRFMPNVLCPDLDPPCGILGACCDAGLSCLFTGFESECHAIQGRFFAGQSCPDFVCPPDCTHRIDLHDCYGDGWNGNTLDVLVNGVAVLSQVTLPRGAGPLSYDFEAGGGDSIQTIYYPNGEWTYEPYYYIYDGLGSVLGSDGVSGTNCYVLPTGITVTGNCTPPTTGACCYFAGGCDMEPDWAHCIAGKFLGLGRQCSGCPCSVPCPPGAIPEPEPCGDYHDNGCYMGSPAFAPIACGDTICGTLWSNYDGRDADWYQIVTTDPTYFIWTAEAQVPVLIFVIQGAGPNDCSSYTVLGGAMASECQPATIISVCQQPGTYWFWVGPSAWNDWPCEKNYTATLTCPACDLPIGACCGECTACTLEVEPICTTQGGVWLGQNVPCDPSPCAAFYCWAGAQVCDEYISRVQIGTIDNSSGCEPNAQPPQYADYTALSADLPVGIGSPLVVTNGNPDWPGDHCAVWVDWNHDCVFEPTERVAVLSGAGPYAFTIAPPIGMPLGRTWMRVRISRVSTPQPCGIESYGEVEDYSLNMVELAGACCWSDRTCTLELPSECDGAFQGVGTTCDAQPCGCRGDLNCDGNVNFGDINPFVMILGNRSAWQQSFPGCPWRNGDTDGNGRVGFEDINPFVALLVAGGGVCP
jgi:hypothetical protein